MKSMVFKELQLLSLKNRTANEIQFDQGITVIYSNNKNKTGKSSVIKSLYSTFGAKVDFDQKWKDDEVIHILNFSIDYKEYILINNNGTFSLFNDKKELMGTWSKITEELAPQIASLLDYKLTLQDRNGKQIIPPPSYFFLPFYIDQDKSWSKNWDSFESLGQLSNWSDIVKKYHFGILKDEYFEVCNEISICKDNLNQLTSNIHSLQYALKKYNEELTEISSFDINIEEFQNEIEQLNNEIGRLQLIQDEYKAVLMDYYDEKLLLDQQKDDVERTIKGLKVQYEAHERICTKCGQTHETDFNDRLETIENEAMCYQLLNEVQLKLDTVIKNIEEKKLVFHEKVEEVSKLRFLMDKKNGTIKFHDIVRIEGKKQFRDKIKKDLIEEESQKLKIEKRVSELQKAKKKLSNPKEIKNIINAYQQYIKTFMDELNLPKVDIKKYSNINANIKEKGSNQPRALLAYYYSVLNVNYIYSNSTFCPIVIDSPNQQDQGDENYKKMLNLIFNKRPKGSQVILGTVNRPDVKFEGKEVVFEDEYNLLSKDKFERIFNKSKVYFDKINLL